MNKQYFTDEFKIEAVKQITELGYSTSEVASRFTYLKGGITVGSEFISTIETLPKRVFTTSFA